VYRGVHVTSTTLSDVYAFVKFYRKWNGNTKNGIVVVDMNNNNEIVVF
jgi:hypothetical protein